MTYEYECDKCELAFEIVKPMSECSDPEYCTQCSNPLRRVFSSSISFTGTSVKDAEYYHSFGEVVKNDRHRKDLMKKHNVIEIGNERPDKVREYTERYRKAKLAKDYED